MPRLDHPALESLLKKLGQEHLLDHWPRLSAANQTAFAEELAAVDWELVREVCAEKYAAADEKTAQEQMAARAEPPMAMRLDGRGASFSADDAREAGRKALAAGEVGMMIVAGGLGTRLGFEQPKGMFPLGPVSGRPLFQILCEQVAAVARRYGKRVPLYVMTSPATHAETERFFADNDFFGLPAGDVRLFCQSTLFALDEKSGKLLLEAPGKLFQGPDGHGGMVAAFDRTGTLADARSRGIKYLCYGQIDNPLTPVCDPLLVGAHLLAKSEMTTLAVAKCAAKERVGNIVQVDGRVWVLEYMHFPDAAAEQKNPDGSLRLWAGNTAVHVFDVEFLAKSAAKRGSLPLHRSLKKVPHCGTDGEIVEPAQPNAWRFERFIFDLLPNAERALVVEGDRCEIFAPVKNSDQEATDNPRTARQLMVDLHTRWLKEAGVEVAPGTPVEISPLFALDAEETAIKVKPGVTITEPKYFSDDAI